jgi:alanyl-tRNA synthetase
LNSDTIRQAFVDFFVERGHTLLPSLSLVPIDPGVTTLFTIAGMQQMIPYFLGREEPPNKRLVTVQRSLRTADIEEVGDYSHLTFLEMLGNFSVGDYFKREAIRFTWDFLTQTMRVPPDRWWATIYPGDEEAREAWLAVGLPEDRIGETDENWWAQGPVGPCGPDSEIYYDRGLEYSCGSPDCRPERECCDRFLETWNDVFMVYFQEESGERRPLPWPNIDTGMGLERLVMIAQGQQSVYETDLFRPIVELVARLAGLEYGQSQRSDRSLRIITDHSRAITFLTADGVMPSSEGRGYVLRRLLRRAALHGRLLGIERPFLSKPVEKVIELMCGYYTYLPGRRQDILQVIQSEEGRFLKTLTHGLSLFEEVAAHADTKLSGEQAFVLYDTHGFPFELTLELAEEHGLQVDRKGFEQALRRQQERAKRAQKSTHALTTTPDTYASIAARVAPTTFTGYDELSTATKVVAIVADGRALARAEAGDQVEIILAATPFYAEAGGQVGDTGVIRTDNGFARVSDTQRPHASLIVHRAEVVEGSIAVDDAAVAEVDMERRLHILPHHSGTHLVHKALQDVLGPDATQAGSLVAPDRLRFDLRFPRALTPDEIRDVQDRVNAAIWANLPVRTKVEPYELAIQEGAMALFGEKYGDLVRVVSIGDWSKELCGGTHVHATGDIGLLVITSETGIGSGVRRLEALAGAAAYAYVNDLREQLAATAEALETGVENVSVRARQLVRELRDQEKRGAALARELAAREAEALLSHGTSIDGVTVVADQIAADTRDYLAATTDAVKSRLDRGIVVLGSVVGSKPAFTMAVTRNLTHEGFRANVILNEAVQRGQGGAAGAGGNAEFAKGGGNDASKVEEVLEAAVSLIRQKAEG